MPTFTVVGGANGAGKTTLTRWGREGFQESAALDPDAIALSLQTAIPEGGSVIDAGRAVLTMAEKLLADNQSFLVETTLSGNTYLKMIARARAIGYRTILLYVGTADVSINLQRVRVRVAKGGHDVPEEDQLRRYPRSLENLRRALEVVDEAVLFDNSTSLGPVKVAIKTEGRIELFEPLPEWAAFLRNQRAG